MSAWLEALLGKVFNSGVSIPLSQGLNFASGLTAALNPTTKQIDVNLTPAQAHANTLAPMLRGVGLTVDASGKLAVRPRLRSPQLQEYFISGNNTSGSIGSLGWNLLGTGTPAATRTTGTFTFRTLDIDTSNVANNRTVLALGETEARGVALPSEHTIIQAAWNNNADTANVRRFFGFSSNLGTEPSTVAECLGIYYDSAVSANYQLISRVGSAGAPVDTGVPVPSTTAVELFSMVRNGTTWAFYIGNTLIGSVVSSGIVAGCNVGFRLETLTAAAKRWRLAAFLAGGDLSGPGSLDDDNFLEV
jgi:hypothetical protein